jgi:hypothetical protein
LKRRSRRRNFWYIDIVYPYFFRLEVVGGFTETKKGGIISLIWRKKWHDVGGKNERKNLGKKNLPFNHPNQIRGCSI